MKSTRRVAVFAVIFFAAAVSLAPPVAAQKGGPGLFPAGTYKMSFAGADFSASTNNLQISFFNVTTGTEDARPDGGPATTTSNTSIFMSLYDYSTFTNTVVCTTLDHPSDFVIDNRLGSATLDTTVHAGTPSCFGGPPLSSDIAIHATWTGVGPLANSTGVSNYACSGYRAESSGNGLTNPSTASLALTMGTTTTSFSSAQTLLNSSNSRVEAHGGIDPLCGFIGFGTGPTPAGHYRFNGLFASGFFLPPTGGFNEVSLAEGSGSSQAGGQTTVNPSEIDLNVALFGGSINGYGCFAIPAAGVVVNGLTSASVQTSIDGSHLCTNSYPGFGLSFPLTVNATWTANGPLETLHDQNNYQCLGYSQSTSTFVQNVNADSSATVTMPDYFGNPVTTTFSGGMGSLTQVSQHIQANGTLAQACLIRG